MKRVFFALCLSLFMMASCSTKEEQKIELLQDATEDFANADSKEEVQELVDEYGEKISKFDEELSQEEHMILENSVRVSQALSKYSLTANSKCLEFGVY